MTTVDGNPHVQVRLNVSSSGGVFTVLDYSGPTDLFKVNDSGQVTLTGDLRRNGTHVIHNTASHVSGAIEICKFSDGATTDRLMVKHKTTPLSGVHVETLDSGDDLVLEATGSTKSTKLIAGSDVVLDAGDDVALEADADATIVAGDDVKVRINDNSGSNKTFKVVNWNGSSELGAMTVWQDGTTNWHDNTSSDRVIIAPKTSLNALDTAHIQAGDGSTDLRGAVSIHRRQEDEQLQQDAAPGILRLQSTIASQWLYLWAYYDGSDMYLYGSVTDPTTSPGSGTELAGPIV